MISRQQRGYNKLRHTCENRMSKLRFTNRIRHSLLIHSADMTTMARRPNRQIRAHQDNSTVTLYQAYNAPIASAALASQKLDASPLFRSTRMTWVKPSWAWMLYRSGYSNKDANQERILALSMSHVDFRRLLEQGVLSHRPAAGEDDKEERERLSGVRIQWDPERNVRLERLEYRSIQIGIPGDMIREFVESVICIEDVTEKARKLKLVLDERPDVRMEELVEMGLVPEERVFEVDENLQRTLGMV